MSEINSSTCSTCEDTSTVVSSSDENEDTIDYSPFSSPSYSPESTTNYSSSLMDGSTESSTSPTYSTTTTVTSGSALNLPWDHLPTFVNRRKINILVAGSKATGKTSVCEKLISLLKQVANNRFTYINVNNYRTQMLISEKKLSRVIRRRIMEGNVIIEDTKFGIYFKRDFNAIFVLNTEDEELEQRLIKEGDFHTPYNDFHIMEPYNTICEYFPYTKYNNIFLLENTLNRHITINARFIKKWIYRYKESRGDPNKSKPKTSTSDGESSVESDSEDDSNETVVLTDAKFNYSSYYGRREGTNNNNAVAAHSNVRENVANTK